MDRNAPLAPPARRGLVHARGLRRRSPVRVDAVEKIGDELCEGFFGRLPSSHRSRLIGWQRYADATTEHLTQRNPTNATLTQQTPTYRKQLPRCAAEDRCGWQGS
jgi:hypothetical protein